jgi:dienelactone hydrolase
MQETKKFKAADGKTILVEVNSRRGSNAGVLAIHGYGGNINEHILYNVAQQFPAEGFDIWRIALYPGDKNTRTMIDASGHEHISDIARVLKAMHKKYIKVFLIGHSYGGTLAIRSANEKIKAVVLWDPAHNSKTEDDDEIQPDSNPKFWRVNWGIILLVTRKYEKEFVELTHYDDLLPTYKKPTLVLLASAYNKDYKTMREHKAFRFSVIKNSDHCFNNEGNEKELFSKTLKFIKSIK